MAWGWGGRFWQEIIQRQVNMHCRCCRRDGQTGWKSTPGMYRQIWSKFALTSFHFSLLDYQCISVWFQEQLNMFLYLFRWDESNHQYIPVGKSSDMICLLRVELSWSVLFFKGEILVWGWLIWRLVGAICITSICRCCRMSIDPVRSLYVSK